MSGHASAQTSFKDGLATLLQQAQQGKQRIKTPDAITQYAGETAKDERCCLCLTVAECAKKKTVIQKPQNETHTHTTGKQSVIRMGRAG